ncbi:hypothetical protein FQA39_LY11714 [Lamprigera yunnana]|nr:hypothetical protein FQA39_LY11714 [Lamprigera yunnana]
MNDRNIDWEQGNRQAALEGRAILERTGDSIARSHQIAIETENVGTEVLSELGDQRETLLRAKNRLTNANEQLDTSKSILRQMSRELAILGVVSYLKFK